MTTHPPKQPDTYEGSSSEINISVLIQALINRGWIILGGALISAFIVGLYSFVSPRLYQSEALILVSPSIHSRVSFCIQFCCFESRIDSDGGASPPLFDGQNVKVQCRLSRRWDLCGL